LSSVSATSGTVQTETKADTGTDAGRNPRTRPTDRAHNPSYPRRTHFSERTQLEEVLRSCEERLSSARKKLIAARGQADEETRARTIHQLEGARDQIAETVRRLPLEAGELYHEDRERYQQAVAAFDRIWRKWESTQG
jgi:hypothetical protein